MRYHAKRWTLDPTRIAVLGVSGGGHVATGACVWYDQEDPAVSGSGDPIDAVSARPDACVLAYPITVPAAYAGFTNPDTAETVWGSSDVDPSDWDTGAAVNAQTPPTFIGHSTGDTGVTAVDHSDPYFAALQAAGVDSEYVKLDFGSHGTGLVEVSWLLINLPTRSLIVSQFKNPGFAWAALARAETCVGQGWGRPAMEWMVDHQLAVAQPDYEYEWFDGDAWLDNLPE